MSSSGFNTFIGAQATAGAANSTSHAIVLYTPGSFQVVGPVTDTKIGEVRLGDRVSVVPAGANRSLPATVTQISPAANVRNGIPTYNVTASLQAPNLSLPPSSSAKVTISVRRTAPSSVLVPRSTVHSVNGWNVVMVPGLKEPIVEPVTVGAAAGGEVEITGGILHRPQ